MDHQRVTIEEFLSNVYIDLIRKFGHKARNSGWWSCICCILLPFQPLVVLLVFVILAPILACVRLAVTHADRVVFVLASSFLSYYQVPRKVFYIYIAVIASTGFLQVLRNRGTVGIFFLDLLSMISCGTSNMLLRKFTTLHFSNPFNRCFTRSKVIYVPIGFEIPSKSSSEVFDFLVSEDLNFDKSVGNCIIEIGTLDNTAGSTTGSENFNFDKTVGNCRIKIKTLDNTAHNSIIRDMCVEAPWGEIHFTVIMENKNLGRLISYFNQVIETNCKELICTLESGRLEALSIFETVKHFNSGFQLVKLERRPPFPCYYID